ncbi:MAG: type II toxin-antitoxin system VapC family toxin [Sphingomonadaceae bacterium]|nr:type II toxin-antitoxin system VapC family toxin [Sphingomonadaceae bacterium]
MRAIDTNVVVRLLLRDDPAKIKSIDALVAGGDLFVPLTVLIETEWVLRAVYGLTRKDVATLITELTTIEGVMVEEAGRVAWCCARHADGADFTDMIHLLASGDANAFVTLDKRFRRQAGPDAPVSVELLANAK